MQLNKSKEECCGCTACENICAHHAITMIPDNLGFLYPKINNDLCVDCGLCEKVCAFHNKYDITLNLQNPLPYAVRHKKINEILTSQSGAAFIAFSDWILDNGGVVYGAGYGEHFKVIHGRATNKTECNRFKGSKYIQSDLKNIFKQIKDDLKNGILVLFSGTPCQTSGLSSFIGNKLRNNLFLIDLICHGVSGPGIWEEYIKYLENKEKKTVTAVNFRDKSKYGWRSHVETFQFSNKITHSYEYKFYTHIMLRNSCYSCPFTNLKRPSDITIGDFWGIENTELASFAEDNKGCSLVLINTIKGKKWFDNISNSINYKKTNLKECLQPNLQQPTTIHPQRNKFEKEFVNKGFVYVMKKYGNIGWKYKTKKTLNRIKNKLYSFIPQFIKQTFNNR